MKSSLKEMMTAAEQKGIAIGAFNTPNLESLTAVLDAAESLNLPVIIQMAECHEELIPLDLIGPIMVRLAEQAKVSVCVHLDHGETMDYINRALDMGFDSVMYDGSALPFAENIRNTVQVVQMAEKYHADVEAELGCMGAREFGNGEAAGDTSKIYTVPSLAADFAKRTGIHALACSFGTTHGIYLSEPRLNFDIVRSCRKLTGLPVVMHGGSGVSEEDYREAIRSGVRKINYFTYMDAAGGKACETSVRLKNEGAPVFYSALRLEAKKAMQEKVKHAMSIFAMI